MRKLTLDPPFYPEPNPSHITCHVAVMTYGSRVKLVRIIKLKSGVLVCIPIVVKVHLPFAVQ